MVADRKEVFYRLGCLIFHYITSFGFGGLRLGTSRLVLVATKKRGKRYRIAGLISSFLMFRPIRVEGSWAVRAVSDFSVTVVVGERRRHVGEVQN